VNYGEAADSFKNARMHANPACPLCKGSGTYMYDHNHGTICHLCCKHSWGYWQLSLESYGPNGGKWCCRAGCGHMLDDDPNTIDMAPSALALPPPTDESAP
jgi:hypothetical protein